MQITVTGAPATCKHLVYTQIGEAKVIQIMRICKRKAKKLSELSENSENSEFSEFSESYGGLQMQILRNEGDEKHNVNNFLAIFHNFLQFSFVNCCVFK